MGRRLFISIDLDGLADELATVHDLFADVPGLNRTDPRQAHVTLLFLGETPDQQIDSIITELQAAVTDANVDPFTATFGGLGVFPSLDYISVIWLGVETGGEQMTRLHDAIEPRMVELGFDEEDHEFTPHVTLARMEHAAGKERVQDLVRTRGPNVGQLEVTDVRLTESTLTPDGPEYSTIEQIEL